MNYKLKRHIMKNIMGTINTYDKSPYEINDEIKPYLKLENIDKYLLFRTDSGEAQTDEYTAYIIYNEGTTKQPLIAIKEIGTIDTSSLYGGLTNKKYRKSRHKKYRNKSKKNRTKKYYK